MPAALRPLRLPGFPSLGAAYFVNELGYWLGEIALAILVFQQTGSPIATAALFCGMHFAPAFLGPPLVARVETLPVRVSLPLLYAVEARRVRRARAARRRVRARVRLMIAELQRHVAGLPFRRFNPVRVSARPKYH